MNIVSNFVILTKNVQSIQKDDRLRELFVEMETTEWDILLVTETWREKSRETWTSADGHLFCGSGGIKGSQGVAITLHQRWRTFFKCFHAINARICAMDVRIRDRNFRFIAVYMPHSGYEDIDVEGVYAEMDQYINLARRTKKICIIAGDFNATVGHYQPGDAPIIGNIGGFGYRNARGEILMTWTSLHSLSISDTFFEGGVNNRWTYEKSDVRYQLDYCLIDSGRIAMIESAGAIDLIGLGQDHRTVQLSLLLEAFSEK